MSDPQTIAAPLPGTFYRRPGPDVEPYVSEGSTVAPGDVVGMIEVMKTFLEVRAESAGVVDRFLVEDGSPVEAGQGIAALLPASE